jgi:hypothetical protein
VTHSSWRYGPRLPSAVECTKMKTRRTVRMRKAEVPWKAVERYICARAASLSGSCLLSYAPLGEGAAPRRVGAEGSKRKQRAGWFGLNEIDGMELSCDRVVNRSSTLRTRSWLFWKRVFASAFSRAAVANNLSDLISSLHFFWSDSWIHHFIRNWFYNLVKARLRCQGAQ